jgi:hypothetical protein
MAAESDFSTSAAFVAARFNEAAAKWPRKDDERTPACSKLSAGFNEAAAKWPRKAPPPPEPPEPSSSLQ